MKTLDLSYIESVCDGDQELMQELIDVFVMQVPEFFEEFDTAFQAKDAVTLSKIAHKAKSTVSIMGLSDLAEKLSKLEQEASEGAFSEDYIEYITFFKEECNWTVEELKKRA